MHVGAAPSQPAFVQVRVASPLSTCRAEVQEYFATLRYSWPWLYSMFMPSSTASSGAQGWGPAPHRASTRKRHCVTVYVSFDVARLDAPPPHWWPASRQLWAADAQAVPSARTAQAVLQPCAAMTAMESEPEHSGQFVVAAR